MPSIRDRSPRTGDERVLTVTGLLSADVARGFCLLVGACPLHDHWLAGEPDSDVLAMGGVTDRYRRFVVEGVPVVAGS